MGFAIQVLPLLRTDLRVGKKQKETKLFQSNHKRWLLPVFPLHDVRLTVALESITSEAGGGS